MDHAWRRDAAHPGNISQPYLRTGLGIDQEVLDIVEVLADVRVSPDHDVEHFLLLKQAAHRDPADQRRRSPAHVTRLETVFPGFLEIALDGDFLLLRLRLDLRALDSTDPRQNLPDLFCLGAENAKIFPVDAHGDRLILAGQALAHLLGEIGLHLAVDSRLGSDHLLHGLKRRLVVGLWIQAYPDLRRIGVGDFMRQQRAANLRRRVAHSWDRSQIANERCGEAIHRLHGCARWRLLFEKYVELQAQAGPSVQAMERHTTALIRDLRAAPGVRNAAAQIGRALLSHEVSDANSAQVWVSLDPKADYEATLAAVQQVVAAQPGVEGEVQAYLSKKMREGVTGEDQAISVRVYGEDLGILRSKAEEIRQVLAGISGVESPEVEPQAEQQEISVKVDLEKARQYGLKPGDVRRAASALIGGITVGSLFQEQKVFDVVIWGHTDIRKDLNDVQNLLIDTESGAQVRLRDVARVSSVAAPSVIHRQGVSRRIDVEAAVSGRSVDAVTREARRRIREVSFPFEYHAEVLGEYVERSAAARSVYGYLIAAVVAIVLLLHAALGSWRLAALLILGAPVAALGGFVAAFLGGGVLTLGSFLGFLAILGLALRNGIIQIRRFQDLEQQDAGRGSDLILRGVEERLRPVVASTITTGAIVLPFVALGNVAGLEILHPAAVVMLGGLVTSAIFALFVLPALYPRFAAAIAATTGPWIAEPA